MMFPEKQRSLEATAPLGRHWQPEHLVRRAIGPVLAASPEQFPPRRLIHQLKPYGHFDVRFHRETADAGGSEFPFADLRQGGFVQ